METPLYLLLAVVLYGLLADRTDRAIEREMRKRRSERSPLDLRVAKRVWPRPLPASAQATDRQRHGERLRHARRPTATAARDLRNRHRGRQDLYGMSGSGDGYSRET